MTLDDVRDLLGAPTIAHVATVLPDGGPHAVPTWIGADGDHVVFVTGPESRKARNLELDPRVCVSIVDPDQPTRMPHLRGRLDQRVDGDAGWAIVDRLSNAYLGQPYSRDEERVAFLVTIDHVVSNDFG